MSYIGNPIISTDFPKDTFSGNGSTTAFTMSIAPASVNAVIVVVSGITQDPSTYTVSGTTLTFSGAPPTGTSNISVRHLGVAGTPQVPADASVTATKIAAGAVGLTQLSATGTPSSTTYHRGDNTWATLPSAGLTTKRVTVTRDMTLASGTQTITGVGFQPTAAIVFNVVQSSNRMSINLVDSSGTTSGVKDDSANIADNWTTINSLADLGSGNEQIADFTSFNSDGMTITWTKYGSPTGTCYLNILFMK